MEHNVGIGLHINWAAQEAFRYETQFFQEELMLFSGTQICMPVYKTKLGCQSLQKSQSGQAKPDECVGF